MLPLCPDAMITRCLENRVFAVAADRTGADTRGETAACAISAGARW